MAKQNDMENGFRYHSLERGKKKGKAMLVSSPAENKPLHCSYQKIRTLRRQLIGWRFDGDIA